MNVQEDIIKETKKSSNLSDVSAIASAQRKKRILYCRQYRLANKESISKQKKEYHLANKEKRSLYRKEKRKTDPLFSLINNIRNRIGDALNGNVKSASSMELLGCTIEFARQHIEKQFKPGMSWENRSSFHIDHIRPCASFDLSKPEEQRKCFNYTNLEPLSPIDNMRKGARY